MPVIWMLLASSPDGGECTIGTDFGNSDAVRAEDADAVAVEPAAAAIGTDADVIAADDCRRSFAPAMDENATIAAIRYRVVGD